MLGPDIGARRRHDRAAEHGLLAPRIHRGPGDDERNASRDHREATGEALTGLAQPIIGTDTTGPSRLPLRAA